MQDAKLFLMQIRIYDSLIDTKLEEISKLRSMITKITPTLKDDMVSGGGFAEDKLGNAIAKIVDLEEEINETIDTFVDKKRKVAAVLDRVMDADQIQVLHKRYVQYKTWKRIAEEMNMSERNVLVIHGKGLNKVNDILRKDRTDNGQT